MSNWLNDKFTELWADLKRAHKSWTIWFNATGEIVLEVWVNLMPYIAGELDTSKYDDVIPAFWVTMFLRAYFITNIILRFKTKSAIKDK